MQWLISREPSVAVFVRAQIRKRQVGLIPFLKLNQAVNDTLALISHIINSMLFDFVRAPTRQSSECVR
jgi:hypothetical protein